MDEDKKDHARTRVVVTDVDIKFGTMVWLMVKASFAAAIAALITSAWSRCSCPTCAMHVAHRH